MKARKLIQWVVVGIGVCILAVAAGCDRGSAKMSPVIEGQAAPHAGWNFGPDSYLQPGNEVKVSGVVLWIEGTEPNDIFGE